MGVCHGNDTTDWSSVVCRLHTVEESMNVSSNWRTSTISGYIVVDFVCNDVLNSRIKEMHIKTTSNEKNSHICAVCQHTEQHPPALRKVPDG